jgi:hypothetical protein
LNVQAVCNHRSQFVFFGVDAPGKCGDQVPFERTSLPTLMHALPLGTYIIGDAAYFVGEKMCDIHRFATNQSKQRCIQFLPQPAENSDRDGFGLMTNKWRILCAPLQTSLAKSAEVLECCSRLHNFCINQDGDAEFGWGYLPTVERLVVDPIPGMSQMHDIIVRRINRLGLRRPAANVERLRYKLHQINLMKWLLLGTISIPTTATT